MNVARRLVLACLVCLSGGVRADEAFRCGQWVITSEMTVGEITAKCGPPASRDSRTQDVRVRNRNTGLMMTTGRTTIETLTWDRGSRASPMIVTVVDGVIRSIDRKP